ncbi:hypothetical protein D3C73_1672420 [compost metagenome]
MSFSVAAAAERGAVAVPAASPTSDQSRLATVRAVRSGAITSATASRPRLSVTEASAPP